MTPWLPAGCPPLSESIAAAITPGREDGAARSDTCYIVAGSGRGGPLHPGPLVPSWCPAWGGGHPEGLLQAWAHRPSQGPHTAPSHCQGGPPPTARWGGPGGAARPPGWGRQHRCPPAPARWADGGTGIFSATERNQFCPLLVSVYGGAAPGPAATRSQGMGRCHRERGHAPPRALRHRSLSLWPAPSAPCPCPAVHLSCRPGRTRPRWARGR